MFSSEEVLLAIKQCLSNEEAEIIKARFGLDNGITLTLAEIESRFGISRSNYHEIEKRMLNYLRTHPIP
ncbi:sigma factor-like helix-turn-helix DNA-binding protein [Desulfitobacterium sp.]|uniref:sigma factor-like helix-turn-helix DNA-binding protein n=1 Tax=Desulfitobacterium sp. TaxID=49981 RepID=UPI002B1F1712|nr:sigma factor-like helix-turn-helix DNA-binding protein [Desulfitobacterium sp.]MEA4901745.1 sigma factor-like helix-turn-helix DNA-binding protein [Desulfitobacterium sp.]